MVFSKTISFIAHYEDTIKLFKDMPMSEDSFKYKAPIVSLSNQKAYEFTNIIVKKEDILF